MPNSTSAYDGLGWFRLNALGAFVLGMAEEYHLKIPKMPRLLRATDELEFLLLRAPEPHERMLLEQYATIFVSTPFGPCWQSNKVERWLI